VVEPDVRRVEQLALPRVPHDPDGVPTRGKAKHDRSPLVAVLPEDFDEAEDVSIPRHTPVEVRDGEGDMVETNEFGHRYILTLRYPPRSPIVSGAARCAMTTSDVEMSLTARSGCLSAREFADKFGTPRRRGNVANVLGWFPEVALEVTDDRLS
jgi:hypothetical protein